MCCSSRQPGRRDESWEPCPCHTAAPDISCPTLGKRHPATRQELEAVRATCVGEPLLFPVVKRTPGTIKYFPQVSLLLSICGELQWRAAGSRSFWQIRTAAYVLMKWMKGLSDSLPRGVNFAPKKYHICS